MLDENATFGIKKKTKKHFPALAHECEHEAFLRTYTVG